MRDFLIELADLCDKYKADFFYTNDDDGVHITLDGKEVFVGHFSTNELRAAANGCRLQKHQFEDHLVEATKRMKALNGHSCVTERCQYCGRTPLDTPEKCPMWFLTFVDELKAVMIENGELLA